LVNVGDAGTSAAVMVRLATTNPARQPPKATAAKDRFIVILLAGPFSAAAVDYHTEAKAGKIS